MYLRAKKANLRRRILQKAAEKKKDTALVAMKSGMRLMQSTAQERKAKLEQAQQQLVERQQQLERTEREIAEREALHMKEIQDAKEQAEREKEAVRKEEEAAIVVHL